MRPLLPQPKTLTLIVGAMLISIALGCTIDQTAWEDGAWVNGYQEAETRASQLGTGMVICYRDTPTNRPDSMVQATRDVVADDVKSEYVGGILSKSHAWDRKYVAQFGVDRSPAIIVLHPDGTYHAHVGFLDPSGVQDFLASATPPGNAPHWNTFLHRNPQYTWQPSMELAEKIATDSNRSMFILYHRPWADDLQRLDRMLKNPAVYRRLAKMVHFRSGAPWTFENEIDTEFGKLKLPAVVLVQPNNDFRVLEDPSGYELIIRLADNNEISHESHATTTPPATTVLGSE